MTKAIYTRTQLEPEMGAVKAQNFMAAQAMHAYSNGKRVCRVFSGEGKRKHSSRLSCHLVETKPV